MLRWIFLALTLVMLLLACTGKKAHAREGVTVFRVLTALSLLCTLTAPWLPGFFCRTAPGRILLAAVVLFLLLMIGFLCAIMLYAWLHRANGTESAVILLGSDVLNGRPGKMFQTRIDAAERLLKQRPEAALFLSGGAVIDASVSETQVARSILLARGIAPERINGEAQSRSTAENLRFARSYLNTEKPIALLTNAFHFLRAARIARLEGYAKVRWMPVYANPLYEIPWLVREPVIFVHDAGSLFPKKHG